MAEKKKTKKKAETVEKRFKDPTLKEFDVIIRPIITEKTMMEMQSLNQVTVKVLETATKPEIKLAFERLFKVQVKEVRIINVSAKERSRGGRYKGRTTKYKKAIVSLAKDEALDLFKE